MGSQIYTFTSTSTETVGEGQIQFLDVPYVKLTLAMDSVLLNSMRKFITLKKKQTRKGSFWGEYTNFLTKGWLWEFFSWCYNKCSCHHKSLKRATILLPKAIFFLIFIQLMDEVMIVFKAKLSDNLTLFFPGGAKFWLQNVQNSLKGGNAPFQPPPGPCPWTPPGPRRPLDPDNFSWNGPWSFPSLPMYVLNLNIGIISFNYQWILFNLFFLSLFYQQEGIPDENSEFGEFRVRVSELIKDVVFIAGSSSCFVQVNLKEKNTSWFDLLNMRFFWLKACVPLYDHINKWHEFIN